MSYVYDLHHLFGLQVKGKDIRVLNNRPTPLEEIVIFLELSVMKDKSRDVCQLPRTHMLVVGGN